MLVYFKVGNYKSIKEPVIINFNAAAIAEHKETHVHKEGKNNILKTVMLYGPNASGKSKILDAFVFFRHFIMTSATDTLSTQQINTEAFALNTSTLKKSSYFEAEFILDATKYRYGFEADTGTIHKEWLLEVKSTTETPLFLRIEQQFQINDKKLLNAKGLDKRTRKNALFLSVASQWNVTLAETVSSWFNDIYTVHGMKDSAYKYLTTSMLKDKKYEKLINEFVKKADLGINTLGITEVTEEMKRDILEILPEHLKINYLGRLKDDQNPIVAMHNIYDDSGKFVDEMPFMLDKRESEGTQKFYNLAGMLVDAVIKGKLVVIDELDARLHTLLSRAIIHLFNNDDVKSKAQLLAVVHDTALMDKDLLRRDQILFVEKDQVSATKVTNLVEFKVRKESPFYKNYLEGKYGAIPFIENLKSTLEDVKED